MLTWDKLKATLCVGGHKSNEAQWSENETNYVQDASQTWSELIAYYQDINKQIIRGIFGQLFLVFDILFYFIFCQRLREIYGTGASDLEQVTAVSAGAQVLSGMPRMPRVLGHLLREE